MFNFITDQVCVAQFSEDDAWYRAQVIGLPGRRRVQVRYVDFGNMELVPYWKLRKITEKFMRLPTMVNLKKVCRNLINVLKFI